MAAAAGLQTVADEYRKHRGAGTFCSLHAQEYQKNTRRPWNSNTFKWKAELFQGTSLYSDHWRGFVRFTAKQRHDLHKQRGVVERKIWWTHPSLLSQGKNSELQHVGRA